jgi:Ig-like domain-containing protein/CARDB protein
MFRQKFLAMTLLVVILFTQFIPQASAAGICDWAKFISDVTVTDGAYFPAGAPFVKTWRLQNIGTCTWTTSYSLVYYSGEQLGGVTPVMMPKEVKPGEMVNISINMVAPQTGGYHDSTWILSNASGVRFGISSLATLPIWVTIFVIESNMVAFDFAANAPYAQWKSGAGVLPFPGTSGDTRGYAIKLDNPRLEDGSLDPQPGLLAVPQNKNDGYIQATYPEFLVQQGDRLRTTVNCEYGATGCYATFRVDYQTSNGVVKTLWKYTEAYEGKVYHTAINLDALAGQNVKFILMVLATGSASGDRALWGAPRILRLGTGTPPPLPTVTSLPPLTPTATPFSTPPVISPTNCDKAAFVADITVPDGTLFSPNAAFTKTWRLKNAGSCTWTKSYSIVFYSGDQMGAPTSVNFPWSVAPGQTVDLTVNMIAPASEGKYRGFWILRNASGALFGIGKSANAPFWLEINVRGGTLNEMGYDFWSNACSAQWKSGSAILPCPGTEGDSKGFVTQSNSTQLEDGTLGPAPSLLLSPENKYNGYIQGTYPAITVQPGDRFFANVGCEYSYSCYVTFRLDYMSASGSIKTFWSRREQNEGQNHIVDVSLTPLAGQSVRFILTILATGNAVGDRVRWIAPYILHIGGSTPLTPISTPVPGLIIRGRVTKDGIGLPNVDIYRTFANYSGQLVATTDTNGYYTSDFWYIPGDETINVWAVQEGYAFDPPVYYWRHYFGKEDRTLDFTASYAVTATPLPDQWPTYTNLTYGFAFKYPNGGEVVAGSNANLTRINLPFVTGTNLVEKYMNVVVVENANPCRSPLAISANVMTSQNITVNGITFLLEEAGEGATGNFYKWVAYTTLRGNACISLEFVLHSINPGVYSTPPPQYNEPAESSVFYDIVTFFGWRDLITETPSPTPTQTPSPVSALPDLKIIQINYELQNSSCLLPGDVFGVRVWVQNQGQGAAGSFMVQLNEAQLPVSGLGVGETTVLFFPGDRNPVTAIIDPTSAVTESDESNNSFSGMLPIPTPPLPCTVTPTFTPSSTPVALMGPYAVTLVASNDVLNIRSAPGAGNPIIGSFTYDAVNVMRTGSTQQADDAEWVEVLMPDGINKGWINSKYLTEYVSHDAFCAEPYVRMQIDLLRISMRDSNGGLLASLVSSKHGINMGYWQHGSVTNYTTITAKTIFTDTQSIDWGSGGASGIEDIGTFTQIVQPQINDVFNSAYELHCDEPSYAVMYPNPWPYTNVHYYAVVKPPTPGNVFDWKVWLIGVEYVNGSPYLLGAVHYVWEP